MKVVVGGQRVWIKLAEFDSERRLGYAVYP